MLTIGEFSTICKVSTKILRYYVDMNLILAKKINPETGYRYYSIDQLEPMLLINRLKDYQFSLEDIKAILHSDKLLDDLLYVALAKKKKELDRHLRNTQEKLDQMATDLAQLAQGNPFMSYLDSLDVQLVEVPTMTLFSVRKTVQKHDFAENYEVGFTQLTKKNQAEKLTPLAPKTFLPDFA